MIPIVLVLALLPVQDGESSKDPLQRRVTLDYENALLETILSDIRKATGIPIEMDEYARAEVDPAKVRISIKVQDLNLISALGLMLRPRSPVIAIHSVEKKKVLITTSQ